MLGQAENLCVFSLQKAQKYFQIAISIFFYIFHFILLHFNSMSTPKSFVCSLLPFVRSMVSFFCIVDFDKDKNKISLFQSKTHSKKNETVKHFKNHFSQIELILLILWMDGWVGCVLVVCVYLLLIIQTADNDKI